MSMKHVAWGIVVVAFASAACVAVQDAGVISVEYGESQHPDHQRLRATFSENRWLEGVAAALDEAFLVPRDLLYHEVRHALIDLFDLPTTGREEDAVDQLATLVLLAAGESGRETALRGANWFALNAQRSRGRTVFWDEHSLDQQRYFNILCWVYGSNATEYSGLLEPGWGLPAQRAAQCPREYARMSGAWEAMLAAHRH